MSDWSGRRVTQARAIVSSWLPAPCGQCGVEVTSADEWVVGHEVARSLRPDLTFVLSNWRPEHKACSDRTGQQAVIDKAFAAGAASVFPADEGANSPRRLLSLPPRPRSAQDSPVEVRDGLLWQPDTMRAYPWLAGFADVPEDANPPLWMSPPHPEAVGSYGSDAVAWIEKVERKTLRFWQKLAVVRQLEHRDDGSLCWPVVLESASRRSGKSVRIRGVALWRMAMGPTLFGEKQEIVHTGSDIAVCRKAQKEAWRWCMAQEWTVTKGNGKEAIETPEGDGWYVRAQDACYGWDTTLGMVDEAWDVKPGTIDDGLEPSLLERSSPQLHMTSTAHRRARSTMRSRIIDALTRDDGETLILIWAAPPGADVSSPEVWRAASPHWTPARLKMIDAKYQKALAGEVDPEADDPDPMAGFVAQYLNQWPLRARAVVRGDELISAEAWTALAVLPDDEAVPVAAAIESWFGRGTSLALAYREDDRVVVSVSDHPDMSSAVVALRASGFRGRTILGKSLMGDPAVRKVNRQASTQRTPAAVEDFARLLTEGGLHHDGGEHLTSQVLEIRTQPGPDGARLVSKGRADAVKAAAWACAAGRSARTGGMALVLPSGV